MAAKNKQAEPEAKDNSFVVMFTALMMILLAFFILLSTMAQVDERRKRLALGSLMGSFGILPGGVGTDREGEYSLNTNPIMPGVRRQAFIRALGALFAGKANAGKVEIDVSSGRVVLRFRADVLFPPGVTEVSPRAFALLDEVAAAIHSLGEPVRVEGHTDSSGGAASPGNWRLSLQRAVAVARYLHRAGRLPARLLAVAGHAGVVPPDGSQRAPRFQRRVEIIFTKFTGV